jgi:hypothetical protein
VQGFLQGGVFNLYVKGPDFALVNAVQYFFLLNQPNAHSETLKQ